MGGSGGQELTAKQREWLGHIRACESSGESMRAYAEAQGLDLQAFYGWKWRLGRLGVLEKGESEPSFRRVEIQTARPRDDMIRIRLPNGVVIEVGAELDVSRVSALVKLLG